MGITKDDLLDAFNRLTQEGGLDLDCVNQDADTEAYNLGLIYDCANNRHCWIWYQGFHLDMFYHCKLCAAKDTSSWEFRLKIREIKGDLS